MESCSFVVWWVFSIDTHSVLTGSGRGDFVTTMLADNRMSSLPTEGQSSNLSFSDSSPDHPGPCVLEFHRSILVLAARLGLLARELRQTIAQCYGRQNQATHADMTQRRQRVEQLRDRLRRTWKSHAANFDAMDYSNKTVPIHSRGIQEHVSCSALRLYTALVGLPKRLILHVIIFRHGDHLANPCTCHYYNLFLMFYLLDLRLISRVYHLLPYQHVAQPAPRQRTTDDAGIVAKRHPDPATWPRYHQQWIHRAKIHGFPLVHGWHRHRKPVRPPAGHPAPGRVREPEYWQSDGCNSANPGDRVRKTTRGYDVGRKCANGRLDRYGCRTGTANDRCATLTYCLWIY